MLYVQMISEIFQEQTLLTLYKHYTIIDELQWFIGEIDGIHYHFTDKQTMLQEIKEGKFIETAEVHGNLYGTRYFLILQREIFIFKIITCFSPLLFKVLFSSN